MTPIQKASYYFVIINSVLANVFYFMFLNDDPYTLGTILTVLKVTGITIGLHLYIVIFHGFLQQIVPRKEPILIRNETPAFMDSEHFYYDRNHEIHLAENAPPELVAEVKQYIKDYNEWLAEWQHNKHKVSRD
ncbi:hypothetical protein [Alkalihalobacillus sp. BA299]|uniref:hypothetical protein n=1 Tax=Alkalihalobacillus sp. BA299 TaxID=2815938 RepID=UPI001ADD152C|nr:hypothetical protein [Alkalihalobacillus sp. BA299]